MFVDLGHLLSYRDLYQILEAIRDTDPMLAHQRIEPILENLSKDQKLEQVIQIAKKMIAGKRIISEISEDTQRRRREQSMRAALVSDSFARGRLPAAALSLSSRRARTCRGRTTRSPRARA